MRFFCRLLALLFVGFILIVPTLSFAKDKVISKDYSFAKKPFNRIDLKVGDEIIVYVTNKPKKDRVTIITDADLLSLIDVSVKGKTLTIEAKKNRSFRSIYSRAKCKIVINVARLQAFSMFGTGSAIINNVAAKVFTAGVYGSSDLSLNGWAKSLSCNIKGSGGINAEKLRVEKDIDIGVYGSGRVITGAAQKITANIYGSGNITTGEASEVKVDVRGSGDVATSVKRKISVNIWGSGSVKYSGNPQKVDQNVHGSGKIIKMR